MHAPRECMQYKIRKNSLWKGSLSCDIFTILTLDAPRPIFLHKHLSNIILMSLSFLITNNNQNRIWSTYNSFLAATDFIFSYSIIASCLNKICHLQQVIEHKVGLHLADVLVA